MCIRDRVCAGANVVVDRMDTSFLANVNDRAVQLRAGIAKLPHVKSLSLIHISEAHHIPLKINRETNYSKDKNLWHLSHEGLDLENPANEPQYNKPGFLEPVSYTHLDVYKRQANTNRLGLLSGTL